ncbi:hypothetical protein ACWD25_16660 [Streptomyces sp. NPDC002920]
MDFLLPHPVNGVQGACGTPGKGTLRGAGHRGARGEVADSSKGARETARRLGGRVMVKAQVETG